MAAALASVLAGHAAAFDDGSIVFDVEGDRIIADGVVDDRALEAFRVALQENPDATTLVLEWVPGSEDDDANLQLARIVRSMGLTTVVPRGGLIASGGVDLFLAGVARRIEDDACVGVHAWDDEDLGSGRTVPRGDPIHRTYLRYYDDIGVSRDFYWFTLAAADADDMHWMTREEQARFGLTTTRRAGAPASAARCEER